MRDPRTDKFVRGENLAEVLAEIHYFSIEMVVKTGVKLADTLTKMTLFMNLLNIL